MPRSARPILPFQIVTFGVWWWVLLAVVVCISLQIPMFLLFVLLLAWRAGELWITWQMLPRLDRYSDRPTPPQV